MFDRPEMTARLVYAFKNFVDSLINLDTPVTFDEAIELFKTSIESTEKVAAARLTP